MKAARMTAGAADIAEVYRKCQCRNAVRRITTPPHFTMVSKYNGEIAAVDLGYPFADIRSAIKAKQFHALIMADSLSRCANCSFLPEITGRETTTAFVNDWMRTLGKPRRIILDIGGTGYNGPEWSQVSNLFG